MQNYAITKEYHEFHQVKFLRQTLSSRASVREL